MCESRVRIVKRDQRAAAVQAGPDGEGGGLSAERVARSVVSEWVREHARRAEDYRRGYAAMLRELGFR